MTGTVKRNYNIALFYGKIALISGVYFVFITFVFIAMNLVSNSLV